MRFDSFLANLLFGLTLFTAFMSLAHSLGDVLCRWFSRDSRFRAFMRSLVLVFCGLVALLLFLFKLGEDNREKIDETAEAKLQMYRANQGESWDPSELARLSTGDQRKSLVLKDQPSAEMLSEQNAMRALFGRVPAVHSLITAQSADLCQSWLRQAGALGIKLFMATKLPPPGAVNVAMVCASDSGFRETLRTAGSYLKAGGAILVLGAAQTDESQRDLAAFLKIEGWLKPKGAPTLVTLGGEFFSWGGLPAGLRVGLGPDWSSLGGGLLAKPGARSSVFTDDGEGTPFVAAESTAGKMVWTSLPAEFSGRAGAFLKPYWRNAVSRVFVYLGGLPFVGLRAAPAESLAVPMMIGRYEPRRAVETSAAFKRLGIKGSFYLSFEEADGENPEEIARALLSNGQEIGAIDAVAREKGGAEFFDELARYHNWREGFRRLTGEAPATGEKKCCEMGATLVA